MLSLLTPPMARSSAKSKDTSDHLRLEDCTDDDDDPRGLVQEMLTWNGDHLRLEDCTDDDDDPRGLVQEVLTWNGDI